MPASMKAELQSRKRAAAFSQEEEEEEEESLDDEDEDEDEEDEDEEEGFDDGNAMTSFDPESALDDLLDREEPVPKKPRAKPKPKAVAVKQPPLVSPSVSPKAAASETALTVPRYMNVRMAFEYRHGQYQKDIHVARWLATKKTTQKDSEKAKEQLKLIMARIEEINNTDPKLKEELEKAWIDSEKAYNAGRGPKKEKQSGGGGPPAKRSKKGDEPLEAFGYHMMEALQAFKSYMTSK